MALRFFGSRRPGKFASSKPVALISDAIEEDGTHMAKGSCIESKAKNKRNVAPGLKSLEEIAFIHLGFWTLPHRQVKQVSYACYTNFHSRFTREKLVVKTVRDRYENEMKILVSSVLRTSKAYNTG